MSDPFIIYCLLLATGSSYSQSNMGTRRVLYGMGTDQDYEEIRMDMKPEMTSDVRSIPEMMSGMDGRNIMSDSRMMGNRMRPSMSGMDTRTEMTSDMQTRPEMMSDMDRRNMMSLSSLMANRRPEMNMRTEMTSDMQSRPDMMSDMQSRSAMMSDMDRRNMMSESGMMTNTRTSMSDMSMMNVRTEMTSDMQARPERRSMLSESNMMSSSRSMPDRPRTMDSGLRREMGSPTMRGMMSDMMQEEMSGLGTPDKVPIETRSTGNDQYIMERDTPMKFHYSFSRQNDGEMVNLLSDRAHVLATMSKRSAEMMNARSIEDVREIMDDPSYQEMMRREFSPFCYQQPRCDPTQKYRSACGACNNLRAPLYGKSFTPFRRIVPSKYEDGIEAPRTRSVLGGSLPSARDVSNAVHQERATSVNAVITPFVYSFGQFLDHDFTSTPLMEDENGNLIEDCCSNPERFECFSIPVSSNDPYFTDPTRKCIHVVRADIAPPLDCSSGIRQQQNQRSSFIDGTMIYGFNRAKEDSLRIGEMGFLKVSEDFPDTNGVLPKSEEDSCNIRDEDRQSPETQHCFDSGDHRQAENPLLTVMHTAFVRRHNLIATLLRENFGVTDDELLFQEAKRMVIAELQHITYNEFLPIVLNKRIMKMYSLKSKPAHDRVYNDSADPRIINAFSTAVFRFGHSLVRQVVGSDNGDIVYLDQLHKHFDRPRMTLTGKGYGHEYVANWQARTGASQPDGYVVDAIRNKLFQAESSSLGGATLSFDLPAMNIQRGRDHGLPGYNEYREWCGLPRVRHFGTWRLGLVDHDGRDAAKLRAIYRHPDDIDLFAGGLSERRLRGALIGPTFACILAYQFKQLKVGDRYWYENPHPIYGFSTEQLKELKKVSLAKVICSTAEEGHIMDIQPNIMIRASKKNPRMTCNQVLGGGHELGYHIDVFGTNFPGHRRPVMRSMPRPMRRLRRIYPYNPTLQHLFRNRLHIKSLARKVVIPRRRKHRRRILVSRRRPLLFRPVLSRRRVPGIVLG